MNDAANGLSVAAIQDFHELKALSLSEQFLSDDIQKRLSLFGSHVVPEAEFFIEQDARHLFDCFLGKLTVEQIRIVKLIYDCG